MNSMDELLLLGPHEIGYAGEQSLRALNTFGWTAGEEGPEEICQATGAGGKGAMLDEAYAEISEQRASPRASGTDDDNDDDEVDAEEEEDDDEAAADEELDEEDEDEEADEEADESLAS